MEGFVIVVVLILIARLAHSEARYEKNLRRHFQDDFEAFLEESGRGYQRYLQDDPLAEKRLYQRWRRRYR